LPSDRTTFFNFLASHDGIGINPARGILSDREIEVMIERVLRQGGLVSDKDDPGGTPVPYELNVNYFDALSDPRASESLNTQVDRFMAAQAIMLSLVGVPGIYFHSLFGSRNWRAGVDQTGRNRTINRQKFDLADFERELADDFSLRSHVFRRYAQLLQARSASAAFHPHGSQRILDVGEAVFGLLRVSPDEDQSVLCLHNISNQPQRLQPDLEKGLPVSADRWIDLITQTDQALSGGLILKPYQTLWLKVNEP
jgi:sucrose phosphorylase